MLSEYMERYPLYSITVPRGSFKPKEVYKMAQMPMEGISTTKYEKHWKKSEGCDLDNVCVRDG